jgi:hypothetical protein
MQKLNVGQEDEGSVATEVKPGNKSRLNKKNSGYETGAFLLSISI